VREFFAQEFMEHTEKKKKVNSVFSVSSVVNFARLAR
jgi:hypothetical protein